MLDCVIVATEITRSNVINVLKWAECAVMLISNRIGVLLNPSKRIVSHNIQLQVTYHVRL